MHIEEVNITTTQTLKILILHATRTMNVKSLKIFCDVAGRRSFSQGAAENGITQSCASQVIRGLENSLGIRLIDRSRRPLALTPEGRVYYEGCCKLVQGYFSLEEQIRGLQQEHDVEGRVRVASIYSIGIVYGMPLVEAFRKRYPRATVHLEYHHPDRVYSLVWENQADLGLVSYPQSSRKHGIEHWRDEPLILVCSPRHELAHRKRRLTIANLGGLQTIGFARELRMRRRMDHDLAKLGVALDVVMEFDNIDTIKQAISVNSGAGILPQPTVSGELRDGTLVRVDVEGLDLSRPLGIVYRRGVELSRTAREFLRLIHGEADSAFAVSGGAGEGKR
jgi:DNA-binding transcriptional LysR family regulator